MQFMATPRESTRRRYLAGAGCLLGVAALSATMHWRRGATPPPEPTLDWGQTELVVVTRNAPTTFYEDRGNYQGPEYELVLAFGQFLGVPRVRFIFEVSDAEVLAVLRENQAHLAVGLSRDPEGMNALEHGPDYATVRQQLVCHEDRAALDQQRVAVLAGSQGEAFLRQKGWQDDWIAEDDTSEEELLARVAQREFDCAVVDARLVAIQGRFFPELQAGLDSPPRSLAWVLAPAMGDHLTEPVRRFFERPTTAALIASIERRYYELPDWSLSDDGVTFLQRVEERLPRFHSLFRRAAEQYGLPWTLLAALAYQESHLDPRARSYTGVRGLMMLTLQTAKGLGVTDRLDPVQSIDGGARYLAHLLKGLPESIPQQERLWFALAAYNLGPGHVEDGRILTQRQGGDPDSWVSVAEHLPLLTRPRYHATLEHGYARGAEAVEFVQQVRRYWQLLDRREHGLGEVVRRN